MASLDMDTSTHTEKDSLVCPHCNMPFSLRSSLRAHLLLVHDEKTHVRNYLCLKSGLDAHLLIPALMPHPAENNHVCGVCQKTFARKAYLDAHAVTHSEGRGSHVCNVCYKAFPRKRDLHVHSIICAYDKHFTIPNEYLLEAHPFVCPECNKPFLSMLSLQRHQSVHIGEMKVKHHICDMCKKSFAKLSDYKQHLVTHHSRQHVCDICQTVFFFNIHLLKHRRFHRQEKKHVCDVCKKSFRNKILLRYHHRTHPEDAMISAMKKLCFI